MHLISSSTNSKINSFTWEWKLEAQAHSKQAIVSLSQFNISPLQDPDLRPAKIIAFDIGYEFGHPLNKDDLHVSVATDIWLTKDNRPYRGLHPQTALGVW